MTMRDLAEAARVVVAQVMDFTEGCESRMLLAHERLRNALAAHDAAAKDVRERAEALATGFPNISLTRADREHIARVMTAALVAAQSEQRKKDLEIVRSLMPKREARYRGLGGERHAREANLQAKAAQHERVQTITRIAAAIEEQTP